MAAAWSALIKQIWQEKMKTGINLPPIPDIEAAGKWLSLYSEAGYDAVEFDADMFPLITGGKPEARWVRIVEKLLAAYDFTYTMHIGYGVDLRSSDNFEAHRKTLFSSIDVAADTGCVLLNLHYEKKSSSPEVEQRFLDAHIEAAEYADEKKLTLAIENIEVEYTEPVFEFVQKVNRKNFVLNYDIGHGYLASSYIGFDFLDSIKRAAPLLGHLHISDNTGVFEPLRITDRSVYDRMPMGYRIALGRGDIHIPPLWGNIPYRDVFSIIKDYDGIVLCEFYAELYKPFLREIRENVEAMIASVRREN